MTDIWLRRFRTTKPTFELMCDANGPLVISVIQSHHLLKQSHVSLLLHIEGFNW